MWNFHSGRFKSFKTIDSSAIDRQTLTVLDIAQPTHSLVSYVVDERCDLGGKLEHESGDVERLCDSPPPQPHQGRVRHHLEEEPHLEHNGESELNASPKIKCQP